MSLFKGYSGLVWELMVINKAMSSLLYLRFIMKWMSKSSCGLSNQNKGLLLF